LADNDGFISVIAFMDWYCAESMKADDSTEGEAYSRLSESHSPLTPHFIHDINEDLVNDSAADTQLFAGGDEEVSERRSLDLNCSTSRRRWGSSDSIGPVGAANTDHAAPMPSIHGSLVDLRENMIEEGSVEFHRRYASDVSATDLVKALTEMEVLIRSADKGASGFRRPSCATRELLQLSTRQLVQESDNPTDDHGLLKQEELQSFERRWRSSTVEELEESSSSVESSQSLSASSKGDGQLNSRIDDHADCDHRNRVESDSSLVDLATKAWAEMDALLEFTTPLPQGKTAGTGIRHDSTTGVEVSKHGERRYSEFQRRWQYSLGTEESKGHGEDMFVPSKTDPVRPSTEALQNEHHQTCTTDISTRQQQVGNELVAQAWTEIGKLLESESEAMSRRSRSISDLSESELVVKAWDEMNELLDRADSRRSSLEPPPIETGLAKHQNMDV